MDERLQRALRDLERDPTAAPAAAKDLVRAGEWSAAAAVVREHTDVAGAALDLLTPPALRAASFTVQDLGAQADGVAWCPDEQAVWATRWQFRAVRRCPRSGTASEALDHLELPPGSRPWDLIVSPDQTTLAFQDVSHRGGVAWLALSLESRVVTPGPTFSGRSAEETATAWWGKRVVCKGKGLAVAWDPTTSGEVTFAQATRLEVADGTCLTRERKELLFFRPGPSVARATGTILPAPEPFTRCPYPLAKLPVGWDGLIALPGGRALVCDQDGQELILLDASGVLARAKIPPLAEMKPSKRKGGLVPPPKLVAVRPCPSGRVVALRYKLKKNLVLVDLRDGAHAVVDLDPSPGDPVWAPSGQALAVPGLLAGAVPGHLRIISVA